MTPFGISLTLSIFGAAAAGAAVHAFFQRQDRHGWALVWGSLLLIVASLVLAGL